MTIANSILVLLKKIDKKTLTQYDDFIHSDEFQQIFTLALEIDKISKYGNSIGNNCYNSMVNTELPTITFSEDLPDQSQAKIYNYPIKDFLEIKNEIDELRIDYGIIFSGMSNKVEHIHHLNHFEYNHQHEFERLEQNIA